MKTVVALDATSIRYARGGGFLAVVGVLLLVLGVLFAALPLCEGTTGKASGFVMLVNGAFLAFAGLALVFGRRRTAVDKARGVVTQSWDLFVPLLRASRPLSDYRRVAVEARQPRAGRRRITLYSMSLADREGRETVILYTPSDELAQAYARQLAEFLEFPE